MAIRIKDIPEYSGAELYGVGKLSASGANFVTDSRKVAAGDVFVAIKGENHDAHSFIDAALSSKASLIIVNKGWFDKNRKIKGSFAVVEDTVLAMLRMAKAHLKAMNIPVVAITGSNGKTTTRAMTAAVLSRKFNVLATEGNFNNRIGLPLTVFRIGKQHDIAVLEMGTNHFGEIEELSLYAQPETALITNIGRSHLEFLKDRKGVLKAKMEILAGMPNNGTLIVNGDDDLLLSYKPKKKVQKLITGFTKGRYLCGSKYKTTLLSGSTFLAGNSAVNLNIPGIGAAADALLALAAGKRYGISIKDGATALKKIKAPENRMERAVVSGATVIADCYNANPDSVANVISLLGSDNSFKRKIALLGTMGELGAKSESFHREIGKLAAKNGIDVLLTVGDGGKKIAEGAESAGLKNTYNFNIGLDAVPVILSSLKKGDALLIKGSHSMKLEKVYEAIIKGKGK
ncbi:MAG: UDP-N-acetylmuramoyl-tripeptide--D-alanyl-D-alanine ligase [Fibrobacteres bacterium]|nr:UDP-N-acetylmuramoyl-tripeptide--D-alanyl-D-alanine ligase [Fibrobacterota bacterium]